MDYGRAVPPLASRSGCVRSRVFFDRGRTQGRVLALTIEGTPDGRFYAYTILTDSSRLILSEVGPSWWR